MNAQGTHLWQACNPPAVLCSVRGIAAVALDVDTGTVRNEPACEEWQDTVRYKLMQKTIAHLVGHAVGRTQCLRGVGPISRR